MKRSELKVGEAYYYDRSTNWQDGSWRGGDKAVVVETESYEIVRSVWGSRDRAPYRKNPKGNAVLVDIYTDGRVESRRDVVPIAHLRGPWETVKAAVGTAAAERKVREAAASKATQDAVGLAYQTEKRAKTLGLDMSWRSTDGGGIEVTMSPETAAKLLDVYEEFGTSSGREE